MLPFVPADCHRVLDVGCSSGGFGQSLKKTRKVEVWGVEPVAAVAAVAATRLDRVFDSPFTPALDLPKASFDCIIFNDVLEHIYDSAGTLRLARELLTPRGCIVASIPNIRHFPMMWELAVRGKWTYRDYGILDRTHLRFFTRKSIVPLFADNGFTVEQLKGINRCWTLHREESAHWGMFRIINALTFGAINDMSFLQFAVVARPTLPSAR